MCTTVKKHSWQSTAPVLQRSQIQIPYGPEFFFPGLISTTSSVVFIAARISFILFFTAVYIYDFHISTITIHHLDGLFGPNIMTSSQLVCQLSWQSSASVLQRSWVQILYRPEFFFSGLISTTSSVVFIAAKYSYVLIYFSIKQLN